MKFVEWEINFNTKGTESAEGIEAIKNGLSDAFSLCRAHYRKIFFIAIPHTNYAFTGSATLVGDCEFEKIEQALLALSTQHPGTVFEVMSNFSDKEYFIDLFSNGQQETLEGEEKQEITYPEPSKIFFD